jgi:hypothetical protein
MSFILIAKLGDELQVNAWNWRPTLELLLNEDVVDRELYERLGANGCGAAVGDGVARLIADTIDRRLAASKMAPGQRMLADLTVTAAKRKPVVFSPAHNEQVDVNDLYSASFEWLVSFRDFCRRSGGFKVS